MGIIKKLPLIIPLLIILMFICAPNTMIPLSFTMFGRLSIILIVLYYALIDIKIAVFLVAVFVYYYGNNDYKFMNNQSENFLWEMVLNGSEIPYNPPKTEEEVREEDDEKIEDVNEKNKNNVNPQPPLEYQKI